jgi:hypothetical protein
MRTRRMSSPRFCQHPYSNSYPRILCLAEVIIAGRVE